jgi:phosphoserine phosphatase
MRRFWQHREEDHVVAGEAAAAAATPDEHRPEPDPTAAAFFDVDNTMMRGASIYYFARGLAARKLFTMRDLALFAWGQLSFRLRGAENTEHISTAREAALAFVAGQKVDDLVRLSEEIYDEVMADRIWHGTRALALQHLVIARRLGLTGALGTVAESEDGVYTGRLAGSLLHGPAKAEAVRALAAREGLDLARCSAYSDSFNDLPMLSAVGHPSAVNPDADLRDYAKEQGWDVYDFRTGRKVTMVALPAAAGAGALVGGVAAGVALRRHYQAGDSLSALGDAAKRLPLDAAKGLNAKGLTMAKDLGAPRGRRGGPSLARLLRLPARRR